MRCAAAGKGCGGAEEEVKKTRKNLPKKKKKKMYVEVGTYVVGVMDEGCDGWTFCDGWMHVLRMKHGLE